MPVRCRHHYVALLVALLACVPFAGAAPLDETHLYSRAATWQETLQASLGNLTALEDAEREAAEKSGNLDLILGPWYVIGSFSNADGKGFAAAYRPEQEIVLDKPYAGMAGSQATWRRMDGFVDGQVHNLLPHFRLTEWAIAYLYRKLTAKQAMELTGYFGSDDGLAVWLNGERIIATDVPRGPGPDQDKATLKLKAGENALLLKIVNRTGGWGFYFSTRPGGGSPDENPTHRRRVNVLWDRVRADFSSPEDQRQMRAETADGIWPVSWRPNDTAALARRYTDATGSHFSLATRRREGLQADLGAEGAAGAAGWVAALAADRQGPAGRAAAGGEVGPARTLYHRTVRLADVLSGMARLVSTRLAVDDLAATFTGRYAGADGFRQEQTRLWARAQTLIRREGDTLSLAPVAELEQWEAAIGDLQQQALVVANPLLDFDRLLFLTRKPGGGNPGLPQNWQSNSSMRRTGWDSAISVLSPPRAGGAVETVYHSDRMFVGDLDVSFDGQRVLFSMPAAEKADRYQVWEIGADGTGLRMVTAAAANDYDNYDACYLPNGKLAFTSSRCYQAVPCTGGDHVALLYLMDADGSNVRQVTFDQDHSWNPAMLNDGRVLYTRWEYNDIPHYFSRILFAMNPDGTRQMAVYGTNSWYPNTIIGARAVPGSLSRVCAILSGHHGNPRMGEVAILDLAHGEQEATGVVRIMPQRHRTPEPLIIDQYATGTWPQFTHPYPLSDKYVLVSCKPSPTDWWGLYLVDAFDNLVPLRVEPGAALMEPIPLHPTPPPPIIPTGVDLTRADALVYLNDVYRGPGLRGVPRGTVTHLRLIEPVYRYWGNGETHSAAVDGGWDVKRILGTVPVGRDGSAFFRVPANTPLMVQPLNGQGMAQQQMRSWFTAMPGEVLSCVGCHEQRKDVVGTARRSRAQAQPPTEITPWYGPARGFAFEREVQPVLDKNCLRCHATGPIDLRGRNAPGNQPDRFSSAYLALHPFVRRPGLESDIHILPPREFEASTSQLVQMLRKGHRGVRLTPEDWDRLITWIDLNVPYAGDWQEAYPPASDNLVRRREEIRRQDAAVLAREAARR